MHCDVLKGHHASPTWAISENTTDDSCMLIQVDEHMSASETDSEVAMASARLYWQKTNKDLPWATQAAQPVSNSCESLNYSFCPRRSRNWAMSLANVLTLNPVWLSIKKSHKSKQSCPCWMQRWGWKPFSKSCWLILLCHCKACWMPEKMRSRNVLVWPWLTRNTTDWLENRCWDETLFLSCLTRC